MAEARRLPPPLPPRLDWFVHTQADLLAQSRIPDWFHGTISRETAENLLESQPLGTFLIRVSHSHVGYTLSYNGRSLDPESQACKLLSPKFDFDFLEHSKAQTCCRHFMVKLLEDGTFAFSGDHVTHASLDALVAFHQQKPIRPFGELLTRACGQADPANVDYEDLFLYSNALVQDAENQVQTASSCPPEEASERKQSTTEGEFTSASYSPKALFEESGQKLWKNLRSLPQTSRKVKQRLTSHLSAMSLLGDAGRVQPHHSRVTRASSWDSARLAEDPCAATTSLQNPAEPEAPRGREAIFRDSRPANWKEALSGVKAWRGKVVRALSAQEPVDRPEAPGWLPEEYLPPPPFAPGY